MRRSVQVPGLQPGAAYDLQIRGTNNEDGYGPWSPIFHFTAGLDVIAPSPVSNLNTNWDGLDLIITWDAPVTNEDGTPLVDFQDFVLEVSDGTTDRTFYLVDETFDFLYGLNREAFGSATANITVTVYVRDNVGNMSEPAVADVSKSGPDAPVLSATAKVNAVELTWTDVFDDDGRHYEIWKDDAHYVSISTGTTTWTDTDVGDGGHDYFVRAVDWFGQSADSNVVTESQFESGTQDSVEPNVPTNLAYSETVTGAEATATLSWSAPVDNVDATAYEDHEGFQVRWRTDGTQPWNYEIVPDERTNGTDPGTADIQVTIAAGATLDWGVRAFDRYSNFSSWAISQDTAGVDDTQPETPSTPSVYGEKQSILVVHDLHDDTGTGTPLIETVDHLDIYVGTVSGFVIDPDPVTGNKASTASVDSRIYMGIDLIHSFNYEGVEDANDLHVRVVAVTTSGIESPASASAPVTVGLMEGINMLDATIDSAKINNLEAHKLIAGDGIINNLDVRSLLLVGENGSIESGEWNGTSLDPTFDASARTGWKLDGQGLYIYDGTIDASLITLQQEANLIDHGYTMFSYFTDWYDDNIVTHANMTAGTSDLWSRYGNYSLRLQGTDWVFFGTSTTDYNISVEGGQDYIVSTYVKNNTASAMTMRIRLRRDDDAAYTEATFNLAADEERRVSEVVTIPAATSSVVYTIWSDTTGADFFVDGPQLEYRVADNTEPSVFKPGGVTTLSANQITTGTIDASVINVVNLSATQIVTGTLDASLITVNNLSASSINTGTLDAGQISVVNLSASSINTGGMSAQYIDTGTLSAATITLSSTGVLRTSSSTTRAEFNSDGIKLYKGGNLMVNLDAGSGDATFTGTVTGSTISGGVIDLRDGSNYGIYMTASTNSRLQFWTGSSFGDEAFIEYNSTQNRIEINAYQGPAGNVRIVGDSIGLVALTQVVTVEAALEPVNDKLYNLGRSSTRWNNLYVSTAQASSYMEGDEFRSISNGSAGDASFTWSGDQNTGMYLISADNIGWSAGGVERMRLNGSHVQVSTDLLVNGSLTRVEALRVQGVFNQIVGGAFISQPIYDDRLASGRQVYAASDGRVHTLSSTERTKVNVKNFEVDADELLSLQPKSYMSRYEYEKNNNSVEGLDVKLGLLAEEVNQTSNLASLILQYDSDGTPDYVEYNSIAVALIPVVRDLRDRVRQLEEALQT